LKIVTREKIVTSFLSVCACSDSGLNDFDELPALDLPSLNDRYVALVKDHDSFFSVFPNHVALKDFSGANIPPSRIYYFAVNTGNFDDPFVFVRLSTVQFADEQDPFKLLPSCSCGCSLFRVDGPSMPCPFSSFLNGLSIFDDSCLHCKYLLAFVRHQNLEALLISFAPHTDYSECAHQKYYGSISFNNPLPFKGFNSEMRFAAIYGGQFPRWCLVRYSVFIISFPIIADC
jgi:hypothetical protein